MKIEIDVPPVIGFWGDASPEGLAWSDSDQRKSWLAKNLSESQQGLAACVFSRRAIPRFEGIYPDDKRPRTAIETAERFVMGLTTRANLETASAASAAAAYTAATYASASATYASASAAAYASASAYAASAAAYAASAAAYTAASASSAERLIQAQLLTLFLPCDSEISETSKGLVNRWIDSYLNHGLDEKGVREILADSLQDDGVPDDRCQWVRHVKTWYLGMWPMTAGNFSG